MQKGFGSIGIFDSGLGGISVLYEAIKILPNENYIYYGDSKNAPYGIKTKEEVIELSRSICDYFMSRKVKAIVVACNTATSAAIDVLRKEYDVPIIGMEPALKPAALKYKDGTIAVMATNMTLREEKFNKLLKNYVKETNIYKIPAPLLVEYVELGILNGEKVLNEIKNLLSNISENIDALILGCTHFIFLKKIISDIFEDKFEIIDGNKGTILNLEKILKDLNKLNYEKEGNVEILNSKGEIYINHSYSLLKFLETC